MYSHILTDPVKASATMSLIFQNAPTERVILVRVVLGLPVLGQELAYYVGVLGLPVLGQELAAYVGKDRVVYLSKCPVDQLKAFLRVAP